MSQNTSNTVTLSPNLSTVMSGMVVDGPVDITTPQNGFFGYLLRCKAPMQENVSESVVLLEPGEQNIKAIPLDDNLSARQALRRAWSMREKDKHYYGFICQPENADDYERVYEALKDGGFPLLEDVGKMLLTAIENRYDDVEPVAIVCHMAQVARVEGNTLWTRPAHFHILVKARKNV